MIARAAQAEAKAGLFGLPPGVNFAEAFVAALAARMSSDPPEIWARTTIYANSGRMVRHIRAALAAGPARLLPRVVPLSDLGSEVGLPPVPPSLPPLRLKLELAGLVSALIDRHPDLAPRHAIFGLAESLAELMDEIDGEGVAPDAIADHEMDGFASHWARSRTILLAAYEHFAQTQQALPGAEARRARLVTALIDHWAQAPPADPVIVAGSTGSRGATRRLMEAVLRLPRGAVVLPGFDFDMPVGQWAAFGAKGHAAGGEDHPQYRFHILLDALGLVARDVHRWSSAEPPCPSRNRLISLALCPAPVTDRWRAEGDALTGIEAALSGLTVVLAPNPRAEAGALALRLRQAVEDRETAALVTPDRDLARRVSAALARWGIEADDSAGVPLHQTAPGRLLRLSASVIGRGPTLPELLALLKHPLAATGADRGQHLRMTRELEIALRRARTAHPDPEWITAWGGTGPDTELRAPWSHWVAGLLQTAAAHPAHASLAHHAAANRALAEATAAGSEAVGPRAAGSGAARSGELWDTTTGEAAEDAIAGLAEAADAYPSALSVADYQALLHGHLAGSHVQDPRRTHPDIAIWGTLEARVQSADVMLLAGLNEGTWPAAPAPDPWLNRPLRQDVGLLLPERQIGLSAHDFQQAVAAKHVVVSRSVRDADAETVPSRWLNRLTNLLTGLGGVTAEGLAAARTRGDTLLAQAGALDRPTEPVAPAPRPAPCPPVAARPRQLSVTQIKTLIRDPYAIYASKVLKLDPLPPLLPQSDARARGIALHAVMEAFLADHETWRGDPAHAQIALARALDTALARDVPDPAIRALWAGRFQAGTDRILTGELARLTLGTPALVEERGTLDLGTPDFALTAKPDRIDRLATGGYAVWDYKSGSPPSASEVKHFDKQLALEAAMVEAGAFKALPPGPVTRMGYIALGPNAADRDEAVTTGDGAVPAQVIAELRGLIAAYGEEDRGYTARRAPRTTDDSGDYDHLARYGEWDETVPPVRLPVGSGSPDRGGAP